MTNSGGLRFGDMFYGIEAEDDTIYMHVENGEGVTTNYNVTAGSGGLERKRLYTNPDTTQPMGATDLFNVEDGYGYQYLAFTVTNTAGDFVVEELCELEPLRAAAGQFVLSMPINNALYARKVYRSSGMVKASAKAYELGKTTDDPNQVIIKSVDAVKGAI